MMSLKRSKGKMFKKILSVFLAMVISIGFISGGMSTASAADSGDGWSLDDDGLLTIMSDVGMADWAYNWHYRNRVRIVAIQDGVTSIGVSAFTNCTWLTEITIPSSVTSIGDSAFSACIGLTEITIPDSVTSIGDSAFSACRGLTEITIPDSVTSIGNSAFYRCSGLTEITIPDSVTSIGERAFYGCTGLTEIKVSANNQNFTDIDGVLFNKSVTELIQYPGMKQESSYTIPYSVTSIGDFAFSNCTGLTEIIIPNSVTSVGREAFSYCTGLTSVTIGNSVTSVGSEAFSFCTGLTEITIPDSVTSIGSSAFWACTGLTEIKVSADNQNYMDIDGVLFNKAATTLITYPPGRQGSYTIPYSVTYINSQAFSLCRGLTEITIPNSVTSIGNSAFSYCTGLTEITIPDSVTHIGSWAFSYCDGLTSMVFKSQTPPEFVFDIFRNVPSSMTVYVPIGARAAYQAEDELSRFNIVEGEPSIIGDCNRDGKINIADLTYLKRVVVGYMPHIFINNPECWLDPKTRAEENPMPKAEDITRLKDFLTGKSRSLTD